MNEGRIRLALMQGLSIVCATCTRYWLARDAGIPGHQCLSKRACGSPIAGKTFPDYDGPITNFESLCFVCGLTAAYAVRHPKSPRKFGLCKEHVRYMTELVPDAKRGEPSRTPVEVVEAGGKLIDVARLLGKKKPTLAETLQEAETYFEERDQRVRGSR